MKILILIFLITGCGYFDKEEPQEQDVLNDEMTDLYYERLETASKYKEGWPSLTDCDGLVWAGVACRAGVKVNIVAAMDEGRFYRTPSKTCYKEGRSRSTVSADGIVAALGCVNTDTAVQMARYGEDHNWVFGEPWYHAYLKPHFQGLLGRVTGEGKSYSYIPMKLIYSDEDYVAHIQTLAMLTEMKVNNGLSKSNIDLLRRYHERDPEDYLIRSVYGLYNSEVSKPFTQVQPPSYVRGDSAERFALVHWLLAARIYLSL